MIREAVVVRTDFDTSTSGPVFRPLVLPSSPSPSSSSHNHQHRGGTPTKPTGTPQSGGTTTAVMGTPLRPVSSSSPYVPCSGIDVAPGNNFQFGFGCNASPIGVRADASSPISSPARPPHVTKRLRCSLHPALVQHAARLHDSRDSVFYVETDKLWTEIGKIIEEGGCVLFAPSTSMNSGQAQRLAHRMNKAQGIDTTLCIQPHTASDDIPQRTPTQETQNAKEPPNTRQGETEGSSDPEFAIKQSKEYQELLRIFEELREQYRQHTHEMVEKANKVKQAIFADQGVVQQSTEELSLSVEEDSNLSH
ncbi:hypothetical protein Pelo_13446 [Pelomyxa schiedti]|nr:hypothetical protein Pelo_13446 [Pelomyxa schiedti]